MQNVIQLNHIAKRFGSFVAIEDVSVEIQPGVTGLLGPNGAGKSTLIKILLGLLQPTSGTGSVLGCDLLRESGRIREQVGYMPEDDCYFAGLTGIECVQTAARLARIPKLEALRRAHEILDFCGAGQERYRLASTYSTGMRQKLRFAQAIVHAPPLLILDEPTSGLDPEEREGMLNRIHILAAQHNKSVLLCTHILPDVQSVSDSVVILAGGRVQVADTLEVLSRPVAPSLEIRVVGDATEFIQKLEKQGIEVNSHQAGTYALQGEAASLGPLVWRAAKECHIGIRWLSPAQNSLEEIFMRAVGEQPDAAA